VPFSYIGRLAEGAQTTVFLAAGDRNLVVKAGDVIDNTYKVEEIGQSTLVLTYLPSNVRQTMPIGAPQ
jgi:Tfp pilus assembly protein PilP